MFDDLASKAERNLGEAKKDNDFIYHERIPDIKAVDPIGKAQPAKVLQLSHPMSQNFKGEIYIKLTSLSVSAIMW